MPEINAAISLPFKHGELALTERIRLGKSLRSRGYTQAIMLTNSFKSAILPFAAGIPRRTGFLGELRFGLLNDIRPLDKKTLPRTVDRFLALGMERKSGLPGHIQQPGLLAKPDNALQTLQKLGHPPPATPVLGLCPGAEYGEAKRWPAEYYAEVAHSALAQGWEVWLFGSDKDVPVTSQINALAGGKCLDLGGKTKLGEAIDLMSLTSAVVSNDSGLMHVAAALDKKVVAIFGSSDPYHTPPMSNRAQILYLNLVCSPCFKRGCPLGHLRCLKDISPESVMHRLRSSISQPDLIIARQK
jgi:heptosyltransferase-2